MNERNDRPETRPARHAAGTDPAKRDQILQGAHSVFSRLGFDAASMNDISREAGVSKGTLYVYFSNKEALFGALVARERDRLFKGKADALYAPGPLGGRLRTFGLNTARILCSDEVVSAQRIVMGICERMPEMGAEFYEGGAQRAAEMLADLFEAETARGALRTDDPRQAAHQFTALATAGLLRRRLFGHMADEPTEAELEATVDAAVATFMARYEV